MNSFKFLFAVIVNKKPLSVKPSKIVAGHEPEKTNELLQEIARAISSKVKPFSHEKKKPNIPCDV